MNGRILTLAFIAVLAIGIAPAFAQGDAAKGAAVFAAQKCSMCHSVAGKGGKLALDTAGGNLSKLSAAEQEREIGESFDLIDSITGNAPAFAMALPAINYPLIYPAIFLLLPVLALSHIIMGYVDKTKWVENSPRLVKAAWCCALMLMILVFSPDKSPKFIYFQF